MRHRIKRSSATRIGFLFALLATVAFVIAACGGDDDDDSDTASDSGGEMTEVAIGTQPWIGYGPFWIADEQGFDTDHGVDIKLVNFSTDQDLESGFASGKFQAANNANNTMIRLADLGLDFKIALMEDVSLEADAVVSCNPDIQSIEDVEGAKVAFEEFSVSDVLFRYALNEAGVDFESIDYTPIPASDAGTAAVAGRVDVAVTYEPYLQAAIEEGDNCEIIYTAGENPGLISDGLAVNTEFAESNPEAVTASCRRGATRSTTTTRTPRTRRRSSPRTSARSPRSSRRPSRASSCSTSSSRSTTSRTTTRRSGTTSARSWSTRARSRPSPR